MSENRIFCCRSIEMGKKIEHRDNEWGKSLVPLVRNSEVLHWEVIIAAPLLVDFSSE
jgi:hypothetical protein